LIGRRNRNWLFIIATLLVMGVLFLLTRVNLAYLQQNPVGGQTFVIQWVSLRGFLTEGISPYSQEVMQRTQREVYGRIARPGEDQLRFISPLYAALVFFPFALIPDMLLARALWMTLLEAALLLLAYISIRLAGWRPGLSGWIVCFLFAVFWLHSFQPLMEGDPIILVALMLAGALLAIGNESDELAGLLLALATINFYAILLPVAFILFWAGAHRRWTIVGWTGGTMLLLGAIAALLLPDWILQNTWQMVAYLNNPPPGNIRAVLIELLPDMGNRLGYAIMGIFGLLVVIEWIILRRAEFRGFLWMVYLTIAASLWLGPLTEPGNYIVAFPALPMVFALWEERWRRMGRAISFITMVILFFGLWALYLPNAGWQFSPSFDLAFYFPLPIFLLFVLYWVRWWALNPPMWFDVIYQRENPGRI